MVIFRFLKVPLISPSDIPAVVVVVVKVAEMVVVEDVDTVVVPEEETEMVMEDKAVAGVQITEMVMEIMAETETKEVVRMVDILEGSKSVFLFIVLFLCFFFNSISIFVGNLLPKPY